jgi:hypothetical protein
MRNLLRFSTLFIFIIIVFPAFSWKNTVEPFTSGNPSVMAHGGVDVISGYYWDFDTLTLHYQHGVALSEYIGTTLNLVEDSQCDYFHPVGGRVTSKFGKRGRRMHYGIDLNLDTGDPVYAAFGGKVRFAQYNKSYGNLVIIRHPNGLETYYAHLSWIDVQAGDYVSPGAMLGLGGNTGRSFGAHLHFETRFLGVPIDPAQLIDFETGMLRYDKVELHAAKAGLAVKDGSRYHVVAPGEDLLEISRKYSVSLSELEYLNGYTPNDLLGIGMKIRYR